MSPCRNISLASTGSPVFERALERFERIPTWGSAESWKVAGGSIALFARQSAAILVEFDILP